MKKFLSLLFLFFSCSFANELAFSSLNSTMFFISFKNKNFEIGLGNNNNFKFSAFLSYHLPYIYKDKYFKINPYLTSIFNKEKLYAGIAFKLSLPTFFTFNKSSYLYPSLSILEIFSKNEALTTYELSLRYSFK